MVVPGPGAGRGERADVFQCSLCRAVWWFMRALRWRWMTRTFSALSVEPYGGSISFSWSCVTPSTFSALSVEPYGGSFWLNSRRWLRRSTFSALSVEPYGGSRSPPACVAPCKSFSALSVEPYGGSCRRYRGCIASRLFFQCSLCRAVWWFVHKPLTYCSIANLSVLSL